MQEFYRRLVKEELNRYTIFKESVGSISSQIRELEAKKFKSGVTSYDINPGKPSSDGGVFTKEEIRIININSKIDLLTRNREKALAHIDRMEGAMECLDYKEKDILLGLYGNCGRRDGKLNALIDKYNYEKSHLYRIANYSLEKISYRLYGDA